MIAAINPLEIASQAYDKDFRWWFLALLICVFVAGIWVVRYLVMRAEKSEQAYAAHIAQLVAELTASRQHHHERWEAMTSQYFKQTSELAAVIAANTAESREGRRFLERQERQDRQDRQ